jgi:hypothetical protein
MALLKYGLMSNLNFIIICYRNAELFETSGTSIGAWKIEKQNTSLPFKIYNKKLKQLYHAI